MPVDDLRHDDHVQALQYRQQRLKVRLPVADLQAFARDAKGIGDVQVSDIRLQHGHIQVKVDVAGITVQPRVAEIHAHSHASAPQDIADILPVLEQAGGPQVITIPVDVGHVLHDHFDALARIRL